MISRNSRKVCKLVAGVYSRNRHVSTLFKIKEVVQDDTDIISDHFSTPDRKDLSFREQNAPAAAEHFRKLLKRYDKCRARYEEYGARYSVIRNLVYVSERTFDLGATTLNNFSRVSYLLSVLRLLLDYDLSKLETFVGSKDSFLLPVLELKASSSFSHDVNDFLLAMSMIVLLKEAKPPRCLTFTCLTPAVLDESLRKLYTLTHMSEIIQILEAVYRLSDDSFSDTSSNSPKNSLEQNQFFSQAFDIFADRFIDLMLDTKFSPSDFASFSYFLTLRPEKFTWNVVHQNQMTDRIFSRLRRYFHRLDIDSTGMICYYLNTVGKRVERSNSFRDAICRFMNTENNKHCSEFTKMNIKKLVDNE
uniref:Uncharacterized protein n=1 Tax=Romanomermis culicivorax TaxID=13658 RepID=A0A915J4C3_ROMCU